MSDEETDEEDGGFITHKPNWRSDLLNRLLTRLERRYDNSRKNSTVRTKPRERRQLGEWSTRPKPFGAPKWTVQDLHPESPVATGLQNSSQSLTPDPDIEHVHPSDSSYSVTPNTSSPVRRTGSFSGTPSGIPDHRAGSFSGTPSGIPDHRAGSFSGTPSGIPDHRAGPTHLFISSDSDESDDELTTLIRAATMQL